MGDRSQRDLCEFLEMLNLAASRITTDYFKPVALTTDSVEPQHIWRERVYCYELYHHLRCLLGDRGSRRLFGGMDKVGNSRYVRKNGNGRVPDFIWHEPGTSTNWAAIGVKTCAQIDTISTTLSALQHYLDSWKYQMVVLYIIGTQHGDNVYDKVRQKLQNKSIKKLQVLWHRSVGHGLCRIKAVPAPLPCSLPEC